MSRGWDIATTFAGSGLRLLHGGRVRQPVGARPTALLELYEFEACPFCRRVREACSVLDLDVLVKPSPKGGERFRPEASRIGGKAQFPLLVDPGADVRMYESLDIVRHLFTRYGDGDPGLQLTGPWFAPLSAAASAVRPGRGRLARPSRAPEQPLELWGYEESPFCRLVREALCELEIPYVYRGIAAGSPKRPAFEAENGKLLFPFLHDPNTGHRSFESADIVRYLEQTYAMT